MEDLDQVAQHHVGPYTDARHSFGDAKALAALLAVAGLQNVRVETFAHDVVMVDRIARESKDVIGARHSDLPVNRYPRCFPRASGVNVSRPRSNF
jgi:hypothetical protein